jgi:hypothetical protein
MRFTKWKAAGIAAGVAVLALMGGPAQAVGSTSTTDAVGTDYDPGCVQTGLGGNCLASVSTVNPAPAIDMVTVNFTTGTCAGVGSGSVVVGSIASVTTPPIWACTGLNTTLPAAGSTGTWAALPSPNFVGANYFNLFQNKTAMTNVATNPAGGCTRIGVGNQVLDQYPSWKDGYRFFTNFGVNLNGQGKWVYSVQLGEYDPSPTGGFGFYELGTFDGTTWHDSNPYMVKGTNWDVSITTSLGKTAIAIWADGIFKTSDTTNCQEGFFKHAFAKSGDIIANVSGLTTANEVVTLPVSVPLSALCGPSGGEVCEDDITTVGGFVFFGDVTDGNSTAGLGNTNKTGISYTGGALGVSDTLGDGPTCPTPTFGGLLPTNPLFTPDTACQIDDDSVARGSFLSEFWDTSHGFTF